MGERPDRLPAEIVEPMMPLALMDTDAKRLAFESMRVAVTCETCGKLRRGRTWVKASAPNGYVVFLGTCPACASKGG